MQPGEVVRFCRAAERFEVPDIRSPRRHVETNQVTFGGEECGVAEDIDQMRLAQPAFQKFTSFNQRVTPEITGKVSAIAADVSQDAKTGVYFYTVRISIAEDDLLKLKNLKLVAGMPVEAFIKTSDRTAMSYLSRPLSDQFSRAFREK